MTIDPYQATAGVYDLVTEEYVPEQMSALGALLSTVDVKNGPILDIGCGSGRILTQILKTLPSAEIVGLEPSNAMRSLALSRIADHPEWREQVTVRPEGALEAPLPDQLSGVVMFGVFGHFDPVERVDLISRLAKRLPEHAAILLDLQLPEEPVEISQYLFANTHFGSLRYRGLAEGVPVGDEKMRWLMTYQTLDNDSVIEHHTTESIFHHPPHAVVHDEMKDHGFSLTRLPDTTYWLAVREQ